MTYEKKGLLGESREQLIERLDQAQAEEHEFMEWLEKRRADYKGLSGTRYKARYNTFSEVIYYLTKERS